MVTMRLRKKRRFVQWPKPTYTISLEVNASNTSATRHYAYKTMVSPLNQSLRITTAVKLFMMRVQSQRLFAQSRIDYLRI